MPFSSGPDAAPIVPLLRERPGSRRGRADSAGHASPLTGRPRALRWTACGPTARARAHPESAATRDAVGAHQQLDAPGDVAVDAEERAGVEGAEHSRHGAIGRVNPGGRELARPVVAVRLAVKVGGRQRSRHRAAAGKQMIPDALRLARWPGPSGPPGCNALPYAPSGLPFWCPGAPSIPAKTRRPIFESHSTSARTASRSGRLATWMIQEHDWHHRRAGAFAAEPLESGNGQLRVLALLVLVVEPLLELADVAAASSISGGRSTTAWSWPLPGGTFHSKPGDQDELRQAAPRGQIAAWYSGVAARRFPSV